MYRLFLFEYSICINLNKIIIVLFESRKPVTIPLKDGEVFYDPCFFKTKEANKYFEILKKEIEWQQDDIKIFGKVYAQPRLTALYANNDNPYRYSNITMHPKKFSPTLIKIKSVVENSSCLEFTSCLLNLYRDGQDSNGWHADNEKELGINPVIASLSFGAERMFHMKHRRDSSQKLKLKLEHGSLLIMRGSLQHHWLHQIPKTKKTVRERVNLTFRNIK